MSVSSSAQSVPDLNAIVESIDRVLDELAGLAESEIEPGAFYQGLLDRAVLVIDAQAGAIWTPGPNEAMFVAVHSQLESVYPNTTQRRFKADRDALQQLLQSSDPDSETIEVGKEFVRIGFPLSLNDQPLGALTIYCRANLGDAAIRVIRQFGDALVEIAVDYERARRLHRHEEVVEQWKSLNKLALSSYQSLQLKRTAFNLANEGRVYLEADRVSIFRMGRFGSHLLASSGLAEVDHRSDVVRTLRHLAHQVARHREPFFFQEGAIDVPRGMDKPLKRYRQKSAAQQIGLIPFFGNQSSSNEGRVLGVAAIEVVQPMSATQFLERCKLFAAHAGTAVGRAMEFQAIPLRPMWRTLSWVLAQFHLGALPRTILVLAFIVALIAPLFMLEADFTIEARGELRPSLERHVFAPANGFVEELHVEHGQRVLTSAHLATLASPDLDLELETLEGEARTVNQKINGLAIAMNQVDPSDDEALLIQSQIGAEIAELNQRLENIDAQKAMIQSQLAQLVIRSPISGQVVTWEIEQTLGLRPVRQGDSLFRIADVDGQWHLELHIPDRKIGYVRRQIDNSESPPSLEYILETDPEEKLEAKLGELAAWTTTEPNEPAFIIAKAELDEENVSQLRPGATVIARIHCGKRSLGYVWLHDMIDAFHRKFYW